MLNVRLHIVLGLALVSFVSASPSRAATLLAAPAPAPKPVPGVKTSSGWLRTGEAHQQKGEHAKGGEAYRKALESLSPQKQVANEGAKAAMLSADAHWLAFEQDLDVLHLQAALDVLNLWLTLTGPRSRASMLSDVDRKIARIQAVREPFAEADASLAAGDAKKAAGLYGEVVDALATQGFEWPLGARVVLRGAVGEVAAYDRDKEAGKDIRGHEPGLLAVHDLLVKWKGKRPAEDASEQGPAVEQALADVEARIAEVEQAENDAALAEEELKQDEADRKQDEADRKQDEADRKRDEAERKRIEAQRKRNLAIGLLSGGVVAMGAGAGLLGEGAAWSKASKQDEAAARADADMDPGVDRPRYDAAVDEWRASTDRRNLGFIIGGSVLAAGGLAMSIWGIVTLVKGREKRGSAERARIHPGPLLVTVEF